MCAVSQIKHELPLAFKLITKNFKKVLTQLLFKLLKVQESCNANSTLYEVFKNKFTGFAACSVNIVPS